MLNSIQKMLDLWADISPENAPRVTVKYRDIAEIDNWSGDDAEVKPARKLEAIGWLLYEGKDPGDDNEDIIIVIAKTYNWEDRRWADYTVFPETTIKEIKKHARV